MTLSSLVFSLSACEKLEQFKNKNNHFSDSSIADSTENTDKVSTETNDFQNNFDQDELQTILKDTVEVMAENAVHEYSSHNVLSVPEEHISNTIEHLTNAGYKVINTKYDVVLAEKDSFVVQVGGQWTDSDNELLITALPKLGKMIFCKVQVGEMQQNDLFSGCFFLTDKDWESYIQDIKNSDINKNIVETSDNNNHYCFSSNDDKGNKLTIEKNGNCINVLITK